jgi:hypothetical protein
MKTAMIGRKNSPKISYRPSVLIHCASIVRALACELRPRLLSKRMRISHRNKFRTLPLMIKAGDMEQSPARGTTRSTRPNAARAKAK